MRGFTVDDGCRLSECLTGVGDLEPRSGEIRRRIRFRDDPGRTAAEDVVDEPMSVNGRAFDRDKKCALAGLPRIVRDVGRHGAHIACRYGTKGRRNLADRFIQSAQN